MIRLVAIYLALMTGPAFADRFVALAYDNWAIVHGFGVADTVEAAQEAAMSSCQARAGGCKLRQTRANACISLAADYATGRWGSLARQTELEAEADVMGHCAQSEDDNCTLIATQCAENQLETN